MGNTASQYVLERYRRFYPTVKQEIENGNIDATDVDGWTLLHVVSAAGDTKAVEELLASGASVVATTNDGKTPLHLSLLNHHQDTAEVLIAAQIKQAQSGLLPDAEPYFSDDESDDDDLDNIPDADLFDPNSKDLDDIYGRTSSPSPASSSLPVPPPRAGGGKQEEKDVGPDPPAALVLSTSPMLNEFLLMDLGTSTDDLGNILKPIIPDVIEQKNSDPEVAQPAEPSAETSAAPRGGWFRSLASYWRREEKPEKAEKELERLHSELEQLKQRFTQFGEVYREMEEEVKGYKSLMMSQIHAPLVPAPFHQQNIISAIPQSATSMEQDSAPHAPAPPPPPPPPPPGPGFASSVAKSVAKKTKSNAEREKQLLEIISESELHRSKHKEAVAMYLHVFLEELKKDDILDRLLDHYPRLIQTCAATPRAAAVRMATWERQLFKKLTPQELTKERKNQEWHILKLATKEEISAHVTQVFAKIEAARKAEAEKRLKEQQSSKMTNVVEELKGLLQSRIVDAPPAPGSDISLPADVELSPGDLSLSSSV
eukprot:TRINITY_DN5726_c0_g3_i1.p1 TRINITY_DN5726_c0_g3~~TRINITY_DN5726_c0_g3_i1.p1  ORF type:complete len:542 (-),score=134.29 TRINITY_DN5726_c0_g3_i1:243-1868(-)